MPDATESRFKIESSQWWVVCFVLAAISGSALYRYLIGAKYQHSAAMFDW